MQTSRDCLKLIIMVLMSYSGIAYTAVTDSTEWVTESAESVDSQRNRLRLGG